MESNTALCKNSGSGCIVKDEFVAFDRMKLSFEEVKKKKAEFEQEQDIRGHRLCTVVAALSRRLTKSKQAFSDRVLSTFMWFCSKERREDIGLVRSDLRRLYRRRSSCISIRMMHILITFHVSITIITFLWEGCLELIASFGPDGKRSQLLKSWFSR